MAAGDLTESHLGKWLANRLAAGSGNPESLAAIKVSTARPGFTSIGDFCGKHKFRVFDDDTSWNPYREYMQDISGGLVPDIVLRSEYSSENRIYIEVKYTDNHYGIHDSQVIRYLLHLLSFSTQSNGKTDIKRAVLLAAPAAWLASQRNAKPWDYFIERYSDLAAAFDVTLGFVQLDTEHIRGPQDASAILE